MRYGRWMIIPRAIFNVVFVNENHAWIGWKSSPNKFIDCFDGESHVGSEKLSYNVIALKALIRWSEWMIALYWTLPDRFRNGLIFWTFFRLEELLKKRKNSIRFVWKWSRCVAIRDDNGFVDWMSLRRFQTEPLAGPSVIPVEMSCLIIVNNLPD